MADHVAEVRPSSAVSQCSAHRRELEQQHVPRLLALGDARVGERGRMTDRQRDEVVDALGRERRGRPHATAAPQSCPTTCALVDAEVIEDRDDVDREERDRVRVDLGRLVARAVAALVVRDHLEAGVDERPQPASTTGASCRGSRGSAPLASGRAALPVHLDVERDPTRIDLHRADSDGPSIRRQPVRRSARSWHRAWPLPRAAGRA